MQITNLIISPQFCSPVHVYHIVLIRCWRKNNLYNIINIIIIMIIILYYYAQCHAC